MLLFVTFALCFVYELEERGLEKQRNMFFYVCQEIGQPIKFEPLLRVEDRRYDV